MTEMSPERQLVVECMRNMGWQAKRVARPGKKAIWEFTRPDTGGLWDLVKRPQSQLTKDFVAEIAMKYGNADDLVEEIQRAKKAWFVNRFRGSVLRMNAKLRESGE